MIEARERREADRPAVEAFLAERHSRRVAPLENPLDHPALLAERDGALVGVLTYVMGAGECEILTLHAAERRRGVGTALIEAVERLAAVDALRFYQRRGFRLAELHPGAVNRSRARLKPELPEVGDRTTASHCATSSCWTRSPDEHDRL